MFNFNYFKNNSKLYYKFTAILQRDSVSDKLIYHICKQMYVPRALKLSSQRLFAQHIVANSSYLSHRVEFIKRVLFNKRNINQNRSHVVLWPLLILHRAHPKHYVLQLLITTVHHARHPTSEINLQFTPGMILAI